MTEKHRRVGVVAMFPLLLLWGCDGGAAVAADPAPAEHAAHAAHGEATEHAVHDEAAAGEHAGHVDHTHHTALPAGTPLPGSSLYQLEAAFTDQDDAPFALSSLRGKPTLILMFYGSCTTACPILLHDAARVEDAMPAELRENLRVVLVTIDPSVDTAERLREIAQERSMPTPRWTLLRADDEATRELAMVLGVQYRRVSEGEYAHSALITLLDAEGTVNMQVEGLAQPIDALAARAAELARGVAPAQ